MWVTLFAFPIAVLLFLQYKFLPYHSYEVTSWHQITISLDVFFLIYFWVRIKKPNIILYSTSPQNLIDKLEIFFEKKTFRLYFFNLKELIIEIFQFNYKIIFNIVKYTLHFFKGYALFNIIYIPIIFIFTFYLLVIPTINEEKFLSFRISDYFKRNLILQDVTLVKRPPSDVIITYFLDKNKTMDWIFTNYSKGLNLSNRNFQFAILKNIKFYGVNLSHSNLKGANIYDIDFRNATLFRVNLQNSNLNSLNLEKNILRYSNLENAQLNNLNLKGSKLILSNLTNVNLENSNLENINLNGSKLDGLYLYNTNLDLNKIDRDKTNLKNVFITNLGESLEVGKSGIKSDKKGFIEFRKKFICKNFNILQNSMSAFHNLNFNVDEYIQNNCPKKREEYYRKGVEKESRKIQNFFYKGHF